MAEQATASTETIIPEEELELEDLNLDDIEDVDALKEQIAKKDAFARQAIARAKKAEAENKTLKQKPVEKPAEATQTTTSSLTANDVEIAILKAQGVSQDEIDYLKKLAKVNETSIIDAQSDDLYTAFKTKKESDKKAEQARLGTSRGSGSVKKEKGINSPGLTDTEHKELWRQQNGE